MSSVLFTLIVALLSTAAFGITIETPGHFAITTRLKGVDVSHWQGDVDWSTIAAEGISFAYIKATDGNNWKDPYFFSYSAGAAKAGLIRGAYHFARPWDSSGIDQADWFVANGGGWRDDGITLPGALDLESTGLSACYGLSPDSMVNWIREFSDTYHHHVERYPVIYTTARWWETCTNNSPAFGSTSPLWIARWSHTVGSLPNGWNDYTFWQYADNGTAPGDQDYFNGNMDGLKQLAAK